MENKEKGAKKDASKLFFAVLELFKKIFAFQTSVGASEVVCKELASSGKMRVFNFSAGVKSQNISLAPLAEDSGSRSAVFYAIFGDHLVVKVPPENLSWGKYRKSLISGFELKSVDPRMVCVVPGVKGIISRVSSSVKEKAENEIKEEILYLDLVHRDSRLQEFLKIDGKLSYFMGFAQGKMLSSILEEMHNYVGAKLAKEIKDRASIIFQPGKAEDFEGRYGSEHSYIHEAFSQMAVEFENQVRKHLVQKNAPPEVLAFKIYEWMAKHLAGEDLGPKDFPEALQDETSVQFIENCLFRLARENSKTTFAFLNMVEDFNARQTFAHNQTKIKHLLGACLVFLAWCARNQVSMRDLKPDNILVEVLDPTVQAYGDFGIIDAEAAVIYKNSGEMLPAGTPYYATPSHYYSEEMMKKLFLPVKKTLMLQDWFAAVGIMFEVVTGQRLFVKTGGILNEIFKKIESLFGNFSAQIEEAWKISVEFWNSAEVELLNGLNNSRFQKLDFEVPLGAKQLVIHELNELKEALDEKLLKIFAAQKIFGDESLRAISSATAGDLKNFMESRKENLLKVLEVVFVPELCEKIIKLSAKEISRQADRLRGKTQGKEKGERMLNALEIVEKLRRWEEERGFLIPELMESNKISLAEQRAGLRFLGSIIAIKEKQEWLNQSIQLWLGSKKMLAKAVLFGIFQIVRANMLGPRG